jgi:hypothetical protein
VPCREECRASAFIWALLANPDIGVTQIAHRLGVSPATLYRYIPAARTSNLPTLDDGSISQADDFG